MVIDVMLTMLQHQLHLSWHAATTRFRQQNGANRLSQHSWRTQSASAAAATIIEWEQQQGQQLPQQSQQQQQQQHQPEQQQQQQWHAVGDRFRSLTVPLACGRGVNVVSSCICRCNSNGNNDNN
jgi:hypothetical protein